LGHSLSGERIEVRGDKIWISTPTLALPSAFAEAASRRQASKGEGIDGSQFSWFVPAGGQG